MKSSDIEVGQDYAITNHRWERDHYHGKRATVLATKVKREASTRTMTDGVLVRYVTGSRSGDEDVVAPAAVWMTWADRERGRQARERAEAAANLDNYKRQQAQDALAAKVAARLDPPGAARPCVERAPGGFTITNAGMERLADLLDALADALLEGSR